MKTPKEEIAEIEAKYQGIEAEEKIKAVVRSAVYTDLNTCHDIPKSVIRYVMGQYFDQLYLVYGNTPKLDETLLAFCKQRLSKVETGKIVNGQLVLNGKEYKIRYTTDTDLICDTDELGGEFGDEYSISKIHN